MIFLDKAILYLTQNIEKEREIIEEELEFVIKQSILNYLVNEKELDINELSDLNATLVIDFENDEINNRKKMVVEEYIRNDLKELENEIDIFENGIGVPVKNEI